MCILLNGNVHVLMIPNHKTRNLSLPGFTSCIIHKHCYNMTYQSYKLCNMARTKNRSDSARVIWRRGASDKFGFRHHRLVNHQTGGFRREMNQDFRGCVWSAGVTNSSISPRGIVAHANETEVIPLPRVLFGYSFVLVESWARGRSWFRRRNGFPREIPVARL